MENLKPEFIIEGIIEPDYYNYRIDKGGKRHYVRVYEDGLTIVAPGFHTVLEEAPKAWGLQEWYKRMTPEQIRFYTVNSANYGTYFHVMCARLLKGERVPINKDFLKADMERFFEENEFDFYECMQWVREKKRDIRKDLIGFTHFCQQRNVKPIAIEYPVMERHGLVATTLDLVCELDWIKKRRTALIDLKSGALDKDEKKQSSAGRQNNDIQLYVGKALWEQEFPNIKIEMLFNYAPENFRMSTMFKYIQNEKKKDEEVRQSARTHGGGERFYLCIMETLPIWQA
jgi:hypothetical protein